MTAADVAVCRESIAHHSKSFALASRLLSPQCRDAAAVVYAWCRRADDAIDLVPDGHQREALDRLRDELDLVYADRAPSSDAVLSAFQTIVHRIHIPRLYPDELLAGMEMDAIGAVYRNLDDLLLYCYRVAGTVGLMMCHVMGVRDDDALGNAVHLGVAMQVTNICRDVLEDWNRGRLYIPDDLLASCGAGDLRAELGGPFPARARFAVSGAVAELLAMAERYYASAELGMASLSWRSALAIRAAAQVYSAIGKKIESRRCDVLAGRAVVPGRQKLALVGRAALASAVELPSRAVRAVLDPRAHRAPERVVPWAGVAEL